MLGRYHVHVCAWITDLAVLLNRFLLKYASRDEVELLGRGSGGIVEIRNGIAQYEEKSPLYGFLRYRRRNVIIKYLPQECSRLVQGPWHFWCTHIFVLHTGRTRLTYMVV